MPDNWFTANDEPTDQPAGGNWFTENDEAPVDETKPQDKIEADILAKHGAESMLKYREEMAKFNTPSDAATELSMAGSLAGPAGSGVGAFAGTLLDGGSVTDAAKSGALNFAVPKVINKAVATATPWLARLLTSGGERAMKGAIKADRGYLEKMAGAKRGGIAKMETDIARTALDEGVNPVTRKGLDRLQGKIEETAAARTAKINAVGDKPIPGSGANAEAAALKSLRRLRRGDAAQDDIASVKGFIKDLQSSPQTTDVMQQGVTFAEEASPIVGAGGEKISRLRAVPGKEVRGVKDLSPKEQADVIEANNDRLRGLFGGQSKNAEIQSRLAVQKARTKDLDAAAGTGELSQRMKRLIDLRNVGNIATRRAEANNPLSLTDIISLSAGRPGVLAGSVGMKAPVLAGGAKIMDRTGKAIGASGETMDELLRLLAVLGMNKSGMAK